MCEAPRENANCSNSDRPHVSQYRYYQRNVEFWQECREKSILTPCQWQRKQGHLADMRNIMKSLTKTQNNHNIYLAVLSQNLYPNTLKYICPRSIFFSMIIAELFTRVKIWSQPECSSMDHQMQRRTSFMMNRKFDYKMSMILRSILSVHIKCLAPNWYELTTSGACLSASLA